MTRMNQEEEQNIHYYQTGSSYGHEYPRQIPWEGRREGERKIYIYEVYNVSIIEYYLGANVSWLTSFNIPLCYI